MLIAELSMNSLTLCIVLQATSSENDEPESNTVTVVSDTFPMTYSFTVLHVLANTEYDVRAVATYAEARYLQSSGRSSADINLRTGLRICSVYII